MANDAKKTLSMEIRADGSQARRETISIAREVEAMKRKSEADALKIAARPPAGTSFPAVGVWRGPEAGKVATGQRGGTLAGNPAGSGSEGSQRIAIIADGSQALSTISAIRAELAALAKDAANPVVIASPRLATGSVVPGRSSPVSPSASLAPAMPMRVAPSVPPMLARPAEPASAGGQQPSALAIDNTQALTGIQTVRSALNDLARVVATPLVIPAPTMAAGAGATAARRPLALRHVSPLEREALADRQSKAAMITLKADGAPAKDEAQATKVAIDAEGAKVKPWSIKASLGGMVAGAYAASFKGFGGDMSSMLGLNGLFGGMQSGFGKLLGVAGFAFTGIFKAGTFALSGIMGGIRKVGSVLTSALTAPLHLATSAFKAMGLAAAMAAAGVYAGLKALRPAADMQQYQIQMEVLLKDPAKAKARLAELTKYAKDTNYSPAEVIESANLMEAFGIYDGDINRLKLAGDAANAFGKDIREVVRSVSYLASGRTGEAMESLSRIGVTRDKLKPYGVTFSKSGEMTSDPKKAVASVFSYFESAFGGMTARQSKTWKGAIQQLTGEVYDAFARGFKMALGPLTTFVTGNVIPMIESIGDRLASIKWDKLLATPLKMLGGMVEIVNKIANPRTAAQGMGQLKGLGADLWAGAKEAMGAFGTVGMGLIKDLAGILEGFVGEGGMGRVFTLAWDGLRLAMEGGAALFKTVMASFSQEFQSGLKMIVDRLPGVNTGETARHRAATWDANQRVLKEWEARNPEQFEQSKNALRERMSTIPQAARIDAAYNAHKKEFGKDHLTEKEFRKQYVQTELANIGVMLNPSLGAVRDPVYRQKMGWDTPSKEDPWAAFNAQRDKAASSLGELGKAFSGRGERQADKAVYERYAQDQSAPVQAARLQARAAAGRKAAGEGRAVTTRDIRREFAGVMREKSPEANALWNNVQSRGGFGNTSAALGALPGRLSAGFAPVGERLAGNALDGVIRARGVKIANDREAYDDKAAKRMQSLRKAGWRQTTIDDQGRTARDPATGEFIKFETERSGDKAAEARQQYHAVAAKRQQAQGGFQTAQRRNQMQQSLGGVVMQKLAAINEEEARLEIMSRHRRSRYNTDTGGLHRDFAILARQESMRKNAQKRQSVVKDAISDRIGLKGEKKDEYWKLMGERGEEVAGLRKIDKTYMGRYNERLRAGDIEGAAGVRREWNDKSESGKKRVEGLNVKARDIARDAQSEKMGLTGAKKTQFWWLVDDRRKGYQRYSELYNERVKAGDVKGAAAVKREWGKVDEAYRVTGGNVVRESRLAGAAGKAGEKPPQEKHLGAIENNTKGTAESVAAMRLAIQAMQKSIEQMAGTMEQVLAV